MKSMFSLTVVLGLGIVLALAPGLPGCSGGGDSAGSSTAAAELMCEEHGVPERLCTLCHPELREKLLMCQEHGVPEEICTICHPELKAKYKTCQHGLPVAFCAECQKASKP